MRRKYLFITLYAILILGASFRLFNLNWDSNFHMHPDERAIILAVLKLDYPHSVAEFLSINSPWNTHFFAYGSFPFYLLKVVSTLSPSWSTYDGLAIVGRVLSALFDLGTLLTLYFLGRRMLNQFVGLLASFLYAVAVLPIQLSHFYAVDTPLTFFVVTSLLTAISLFEKPTKKKAVLLGILFGFALATKVSSVVLTCSIGLLFLLDIFFHIRKTTDSVAIPLWRTLSKDILLGSLLLFTTIVTFLILSPYTIIDSTNFWDQTMQQQAMTKDAFTFPYTLQYVGKIPYLYELKNIFFFGLGIPLATLCFSGVVYVISQVIKHHKDKKVFGKGSILLIFFLIYFAIVGHFAVGFMRYMLPLYPLLCLFGAVLLYFVITKLPTQYLRYALCALLFAVLIVWPLSFMHIYSVPNTRIQATNWIFKHIPPGKALAIEHWDDAIPITGQDNYQMITLPLYDPDTADKWTKINASLSQTDYIILASNRLYVPLQKLTDCQHLPPDRCYPQTAEYYKNLFSGRLGFTKVAEFAVYPTIPFTSIQINDQGADESFTVYDHPKIMIFAKKP